MNTRCIGWTYNKKKKKKLATFMKKQEIPVFESLNEKRWRDS